MKINSAVTTHESVILDAESLNRSSMKGNPTNIAALSINNKNIDAEQTKRINHARGGIGSRGASELLFDFLKIFTPQEEDSELQEHLLLKLDTSQALAVLARSLKESSADPCSTRDGWEEFGMCRCLR